MSSYKPAHLFSDGPRRCIRRTTRGCRPYRSFLLECRFGRSGSSGFVDGFVVGIVAVERNTTKPSENLALDSVLYLDGDYHVFYLSIV